MARSRIPAARRRQQILEVATRLFARQGFAGTTTRQVAGRAGVTEALVFRHFPRKQDLYWAVLEYKCQPRGAEELRRRVRDDADDPAMLASLAEDVLRRNSEDHTLGRLLLFSALEEHHLSRRFFRTHIAQRYEILADYVRRRVRAGQFRRGPSGAGRSWPLLAARGFFGMIVYHFLIQELFGGKHEQKFDPREVSRALAAIWLDGMQARPSAALRTSNGRASGVIQSRKRRVS